MVLLDVAHMTPRLLIDVHGDAGFRLETDSLCCADPQGRLLAVDLTTGAVLADLCLTP